MKKGQTFFFVLNEKKKKTNFNVECSMTSIFHFTHTQRKKKNNSLGYLTNKTVILIPVEMPNARINWLGQCLQMTKKFLKNKLGRTVPCHVVQKSIAYLTTN